jgi:hypothetical protein
VAYDRDQAVDSLENGIRMLFQWYAVSKEALIFHAAAAGKNGSVLLMPAAGGGGKSTIAGRCRNNGFDLFGDDLVLICPEDNKLLLYGLPFCGEIGTVEFSLEAGILKEILFLRKGSGCILDKLSTGETAGQLLSNVPFFRNAPPDMVGTAMSVIGKMAEIPGYEFSYSREEKPESVLWERLDV